MIKYLELCVELKKSYVAKEGIYQYKIICQQTYIKSFEDVVRKYLEMAEEKAEAAKEAAQASVLDVDDLDNAQTPEDILLSAVSSEDTQDRTDRVVLIPWVKFLWESYRQSLDLLKNNSRTERLYHDIAHQAFKFCIKYNRKTEFRKLCDNLHAHLDILKKQQNQQQTTHQQQNVINLNNPESQAMHLETRLVQLDSAIQMELWQEAYKATDDIKRFGLMNLSKKPPKPQLMANYYQKLALVFLKANCPLFHSVALFRLFHLSKELRKNITAEDVQKMASRVVAATLAIPIPPNRPEIDKIVDTEENVIENHQRNLASLLGLTTNVPTRNSLIKDLKRMGVLQHSYQSLQELYRWLEVDFHPLMLSSRVLQVVDFIEKCEDCPDLKQYVSSIKDVTIMRLLKEVSQVYQSIEYSRLLELCPFATFTRLEKMVVEAARRNDLQVRIDHRRKCLNFGTELRVSQGEEIIEGPHLQSMPSEQIRRQLVNMYSTLLKARVLIEPERVKNQRDEIRSKIMTAYKLSANEEHNRLLSRQEIIEERKEQLEMLSIRREEEERKVMEENQQKIREQEEKRMAEEAEERERKQKEMREIELKRQMAMDQIQKIKAGAGNILLDLDDEELAKLRPEEIQLRKIEQLEKERREQLAKQRKLERKTDHFERAKRLEEIPLWQKAYEEWRIQDKKLWEQMESERIRDIKSEREIALQHRERLRRMLEDKDEFATSIKAQRHAEFLEKYGVYQRQLEATRQTRLEERKNTRRTERREQWLKEKQEAAERQRREAERKQQEEDDARRAAVVEKQRQKELEIEAKLAREREDLQKPKEAEIVKKPQLVKPTAEDDDWRKKDERESWRAPVRSVPEESKTASLQQPWRPKGRVLGAHDDDLPRREEKSREPFSDNRDRDFPRTDRRPLRREEPREEENWRSRSSRNDVEEDRGQRNIPRPMERRFDDRRGEERRMDDRRDERRMEDRRDERRMEDRRDERRVDDRTTRPLRDQDPRKPISRADVDDWRRKPDKDKDERDFRGSKDSYNQRDRINRGPVRSKLTSALVYWNTIIMI